MLLEETTTGYRILVISDSEPNGRPTEDTITDTASAPEPD
jgi:hypothetical protein